MAASSHKQKGLIVFDFDHSLIDVNSDVYVVKLMPGGKVPPEIKQLYSKAGWMDYMGRIFRYLHENGISQQNILDCMSEIKLTDGMAELLKYTTKENRFDHIIISDSNSVFISHILENVNHSSTFLQIFTNPAKFMTDGLLTLKGYHHQDRCSLSSENLCKGDILSKFLENQRKLSIEYSPIFYVGDGFNDLCPALTLRQQDFIMPRENYKLHSTIGSILEKDHPVPKMSLKASVFPWKTGLDILQVVKEKT